MLTNINSTAEWDADIVNMGCRHGAERLDAWIILGEALALNAVVFMVVREYSPCCRIWVSALKLKADPSPPAESEWRQDQRISYPHYSNKNDFEYGKSHQHAGIVVK